MRIDEKSGALGDVLLACSMGYPASAAEIAAVTVPPGADLATFRAEVKATTDRIVAHWRDGERGIGRELAAEAAEAYVAAFASPTPGAAREDPVDITNIPRAGGAIDFEHQLSRITEAEDDE